MTTIDISEPPRAGASEHIRLRFTPLLVLAALGVIAAVLLSIPLNLPAGTFYWDIYFFMDAADRIRDGQLPHIDFFLSVGALPYYLYDLTYRIWPNGQPLLIGQYSLLFVTLPMMLMTVLVADARRSTLLALLIPFAIFSLLPVNSEAYTPVPSVDSYGLYNRQAGLLLFVLASALAFVRHQTALGAITGILLAALFFTKITGFVAGGGFVAVSFFAGRFGVKGTMVAVICFLVPVAFVELTQGFVSVYLADVVAMLSHNTRSMSERFLRIVSQKFDVLAPLGVLWCVMVVVELQDARTAVLQPGLKKVPGLFSLGFVQLPILVMCAVVFEMQNTGSQEFAYLWPFLLAYVALRWDVGGRLGTALIVLAILAALPMLTKTVHRGIRAIGIMPVHAGIDMPELGRLNTVSARAEIIKRAHTMLDHYGQNTEAYARLGAVREDPAFLFYAATDVQLIYLIDLTRAMKAIEKREAETGVRYRSLAGLDFVDPLPMLLGRDGARAMPMGLDPERGYPATRHDAFRAGLADVDAILKPLCPVTTQRTHIAAIAEPVLAEREAVRIDPCWVVYEKPRLSSSNR